MIGFGLCALWWVYGIVASENRLASIIIFLLGVGNIAIALLHEIDVFGIFGMFVLAFIINFVNWREKS